MLQLIELLGIIAFAISGIMEARRKGMDLVGVYTVALVAAFGGGTLRDLIIDRTPLFWVANQGYAILILVLSFAAFLFPGLSRVSQRVMLLPDALGLGLFSIAGAGYALDAGTRLFIAALLGTATGVFGGVLRDVICNEIPFVFRNRYLYATAAFAGCWLYMLCLALGVEKGYAIIGGIAAIVLLRLAALRFGLRTPGTD
ncbi:MAG TPA: trimeric intracellular cation channel family protein [Roseiflexaceae bacterium]|nr:trimeric intracellular cation channel family protein [Roseiflexaceae bacterium]